MSALLFLPSHKTIRVELSAHLPCEEGVKLLITLHGFERKQEMRAAVEQGEVLRSEALLNDDSSISIERCYRFYKNTNPRG